MGEVREFKPEVVSNGRHFEPDYILEKAKGNGFVSVVVIAEMDNGETWVSASEGQGDAMLLLERAKRIIVFGEDV
jgi:hypothetical protein